MIVKFRQPMAVPLAALVALISSSALATQRWWLLPVLSVPLAVLWWGVRSGVDADAATVRVRGLIGSRTVRWADVAGIRIEGRRVLLTLVSGSELPLPAMVPSDVPRLIAASGGHAPTDEAPSGDHGPPRQ